MARNQNLARNRRARDKLLEKYPDHKEAILDEWKDGRWSPESDFFKDYPKSMEFKVAWIEEELGLKDEV